jgi:hypothetical protein
MNESNLGAGHKITYALSSSRYEMIGFHGIGERDVHLLLFTAGY